MGREKQIQSDRARTKSLWYAEKLQRVKFLASALNQKKQGVQLDRKLLMLLKFVHILQNIKFDFNDLVSEPNLYEKRA